jgi:hypothetical protein
MGHSGFVFSGLYRGEASIMLFVTNARLPEGVAGLTENSRADYYFTNE